MSVRTRILSVLALAVATLMVAPLPALASGGFAASHSATPGLTSSAATSPDSFLPGGAALLAKTHAAMTAHHIPAAHVLLPNFNAMISTSGAYVHPLYPTAPAPMGLGYWGVQQRGSTNVGTISYTNSVKASVTLNSVDPFYLASTSPDYFTLQLNTVLTDVTVQGNSSGQYWIQNVPVYQASTQTLYFEDNIWNFSSPGAGMLDGTLANYSGNLIAPVFYYAIGPTFHMPTPFTVELYNNATITNLRPTIWFNYTLIAANHAVYSGSFDKVEFNSTGAVPPTTAAPHPTFQINGKHTDPIGLLNDAEIMIGGPGGGSTTTLNDINATMGLWLKSNHSGRYLPVPAAYSYGTDTGETSEGIAEWGTTGGYAVLGPGPSLLQPLWGLVGGSTGFIQERLNITPSNAFVFADQGSHFRSAVAAWAPVPPSGNAVYRLAAGHSYSFRFLLSDHTPQSLSVHASGHATVSLPYNVHWGVYTPLWAWNNAQLSAIAHPGGSGTLSNPYVLDNNAVGPVNPLFGEFNDYYYPVFPGILLANTNAYVTATGLTDFPITYSITPEAQFSGHFGTPYSNNLALEFYNTSHVSLVYNPQITGWFFSQDPYFTNVLFWGSSQNLIGGNDFQVQSQGLTLAAGGTGNIVWGNTFTPATTTAANPGTILNTGFQFALIEYESGDSIWNNAFSTPISAYTPTFDLYTGAFGIWTDRWNVTKQPATLVHHFNGWNLSGNILGLSTVSGNFWSDYGSAGNPYGVLPYDEFGAITVGGDYQPLLTYSIYRITFQATNLTVGAQDWTVTINGYTQDTTGLSLVFWEPAGTYAFTVTGQTPYVPHPATGAVTLTTHATKVNIRWT